MSKEQHTSGIHALKRELNPYGELADFRIQTLISRDDAMFMRSLFPLGGADTFILAGFYKQIVQELKQNGITSYSPDNCKLAKDLIFRHFTALQTVGTGPKLNESGAVNPIQQSHSSVENKRSDDGQATKGRRGGGGTAKRKEN